MLKTLFTFKKKVSEEKITNTFVNSVLLMCEEGFPEVVKIVNEDPDFVEPPQIKEENIHTFVLLVVAANLKLISKHLPAYQDMRVMTMAYKKFAFALGYDLKSFKSKIGEIQFFCERKNHPSKNVLYALSKGFFYKYNLNQYQQSYFKQKEVPNPMFLKRLNTVMENFLWDWEATLNKVNLVE
ncbi:MAG: hypothetical protein D6707_04320 [Bacteroidetes bacterium]|nr:MAG: hypothetical protein D6707_04320 [Bacteroidota bacterium]